MSSPVRLAPPPEIGAGDLVAALVAALSPPAEVLSTDEAAALLRCSVDEVRRLIAEEELPARLVGNRLIFSRAAVLRWLGEGQGRDARRRKPR